MRVVFDQQIFSRQVYGGVSRYFCEIAARISSVPGVKVSIVAPMYVNGYLDKMPPGIVTGFRAPTTERLRRMWRKLDSLVVDWMLCATMPDIVHETYFSPRQTGPRRACRVLTIYDMIHEKFASHFPDTDKTAHNKAAAAARADHVICISESTKRDVMEILQLPSERISVIHLGFNLMAVDKELGQGEAMPMKRPFLLYVGNRGGYKNFVRLLEAYGASSRISAGYGLICFGGGSFTNDEEAAIYRLGLDNSQVRQLSGDDRLLARLYRCASLFVYPSLYEGFGIPPLEAMSYACPVVCSNTSSIPEVVGDAGEYFDPGDVDSIRAAIERVTESKARREELIAKGHERLHCFGWDRCAEQTLDIYRRLI
ncbi:MAG: glycosyltransferase family 4 protein [Nitrospiraceae bacterium]|jgi:glycosyltransferase involved in cell wall biosynthesis|nr:glycosyltransferase family 4 protein [Nitrospiraceae bacterium]